MWPVLTGCTRYHDDCSGLLNKAGAKRCLAFVPAHEPIHLKNRGRLRAIGRSVLYAALSSVLSAPHSGMMQVFISLDRMGRLRHRIF